jgi:DNA-binding LytR/AlgR family response regulator
MSDPAVKILVVEDEMLIGAKISMFLTELGYEVTGLLPRAEEALRSVADHLPDIALLDIQLKGDMDGIELGTELQKLYALPIIFLTANSDEASFQRAKAARPYAFLAKPFKKTDLQRALELAISRMADQDPAALAAQSKVEDETQFILSDRIFVRNKDRMVKILFDAILYVEAERNYCRIVTKTKEYMLTMPMKSLEDRLPAYFQRIHRSHIVNLTQVEEVDESTVSVGQKNLPMSKSLKEDLMRRIRTI